MGKKLVAVLIAIALPGTAGAWEWGKASPGSFSVYYVPTLDDDTTTERGDGYGVRGTFKLHQMITGLVEHNRLGYDGGADFTQTRIGLGAALPSGSGLFLEWADEDRDTASFDGYGFRGRVMANAMQDARVYLDLGMTTFDNAGVDVDELFYSVGGTFAITEQWGLFADYKISKYDSPGTPDQEISMARLGFSVQLEF